MFKRALISVSDKTGLVDFVAPLAKGGMQIISTGGTAEFLRQAGLSVVDISDVTGFPEVMDGRVKTLHPHVHMGLLARSQHAGDAETLKKMSVEMFDLVVVNLYPFEKAFKEQSSLAKLIENIDIGGPSMLRSAAKNYERITVVCDPKDYAFILAQRNQWTLEHRKKLAAKVFARVSVYDSLISKALGYDEDIYFSIGGKLKQKLRYGENPQQQAFWYADPSQAEGLDQAEILQGKELSYNNILDIDAAAKLAREFSVPAAVAVKHNNPCGAAVDSIPAQALTKCLRADPVSVFGGIVAVNFKITVSEAQALSDIFLECIVAPDYDESALSIFSKKKNLRLLKWPPFSSNAAHLEYKAVSGGFVVQTADQFVSDSSAWQFLGEKAPQSVIQDALFGEKVCGYLKSNSIALVENNQTLGLGMGQVNRIDAIEQALRRAQMHHSAWKSPVLISDAFFPFSDSIDLIHRAGIKWVLQPGGSVRDEEVFKAAMEKGINLIITGKRHFRH